MAKALTNMYIIDFDDTLFDTQRFKQARLEAVQMLGISDEEYWETYRQARNSPDGLFTYSNERHAAVLAELGYDEREVLRQLESTTGTALYDFLFSDAVYFLEELKKTGRPMILLSLGNPGFQELKTKGVGVHVFFDRLFMVHDTKSQVLEELFAAVARSGVWFINDKIEETKKLLAEFPFMKAVLKQSPRFELSAYRESGMPFFRTLAAVGEYINNRMSLPL